MQPSEARRELYLELLSGASGVTLALFMWGHMVLVGSILTGERGFDWLAGLLEDYFIAQPTVVIIFLMFLLHAALASRKIPSQLTERRRMRKLGQELPHAESLLWIWQVRTGMLILVLGSFHLILLGIDVLTPLFGERAGIEAASSVARVRGGLWILYALLLIAVEFHASVGLYRVAIKWGAGLALSRPVLRGIERVLLWFFLGLGVLVLLVLARVIAPPLGFLLTELPP
ncbi:MAG: hypothetical protein OEW64_09165 [Gammaproteobacteria bacterium]|nr:hypothetical protein [Gammaproteobacteria bacterium]MDH5304252.1 hypothetical protein [Gammaproteobacteria bacterium]MDH5321445.1 hypothetical protein [Gammaproteobacteria bacterium]